MQPLTGKQQRYLRALAHELHPIVIVGKEGVSEGVVEASREALLAHELVKVKLPALERDERGGLASTLAARAEAALVGSVGRVVILYKRHPSEPRIILPRG